MDTGKIDVSGILSRLREDAVREFAEVMKKKLQNAAKVEIMGCEYYPIGLPFIDNLVNEFVRKSRRNKII